MGSHLCKFREVVLGLGLIETLFLIILGMCTEDYRMSIILTGGLFIFKFKSRKEYPIKM